MTTDDEARLRRHVQALATVNRQLHAQLEEVGSGRRAALAKEWLGQLRATPVDEPPVVVRRRGQGVWVLEGGRRRPVRSGLLASALEEALGVAELDDAALAACPEGAPVEVLEAPTGPPFVIVGRRRLAVRGLPVPAPVSADDALAYPEGPELRLRTGVARSADPTPADALPLPTFLIIGAQKSATRWLRSNLGRHPDVFTPPHEPSFFNHEDHYHEDGLDWYRSQFEGWAGEPVVGESTPGYMMWRHSPERVARRIRATLPDVRLIAILRNPIDRAQSAMLHHMKRDRIPPDARLVDVVREVPPEADQLGLVAGGWYAASLGPYVRLFGDQLLVLLHDDLADDAVGVYQQAARHVGVDPTVVPPELEQVRFSNRGGSLRPADVTPDERRALWELFRHDVADLEELLGRDLGVWDPTRLPVATPAADPDPRADGAPGDDQAPGGDGGTAAGGDGEAAGGDQEAAAGAPSGRSGDGGGDGGPDGPQEES